MADDEKLAMAVGRLAGQMEALHKSMDTLTRANDELSDRIQKLEDMLTEGKGGWKVIVSAAGFVGFIATAAYAIYDKLIAPFVSFDIHTKH